MGFTFDDTDRDGVASPLAEMRRLIEKNQGNAERIFPYIGGEEVNTSPTHAYHRCVINFWSMSQEEARSWPDLFRIVEEKVRPERERVRRDAHRERWWQYGDKRPELYAAIHGLERVLVNSQVSAQHAFAFLPSSWVYAHTLNVYAFSSHSAFANLQSRPHEIWARFFASSLEDRLRYTPSDCFETFPFPEGWQTNAVLEAAGRAYYEFRAALMVRNDEGLTSTYNRFHDPDERSPDILELRDLHAAMDHAVLDAYGWKDVEIACDFLLDYEDEEEDDDASSSGSRGSRRRKPWRYRWPDPVRDEVLARLLALNKQRADAERLSGAAANGQTAKGGTKKTRGNR